MFLLLNLRPGAGPLGSKLLYTYVYLVKCVHKDLGCCFQHVLNIVLNKAFRLCMVETRGFMSVKLSSMFIIIIYIGHEINQLVYLNRLFYILGNVFSC